MEAMIDRFGRVLIPKPVRDHLGLAPGTVLEIEEQDRGIRLKPVSEQPVEDRDGVLVFGGRAEGDLGAAVRSAREERLDRTSRADS